MKKHLLFLLLLLMSMTGFAQSTWTQKSDFPGGKRYGTAYFVINDKAYVGLGNNGIVSFNDWWEYESSTDTWTKRADFPGEPRYVPVFVAINDKGYVGMGSTTDFNVLDDWWEYDPSADSWTQKTSIPDEGRYGVSTFAINGKGYIACGNEQSATGPFTKQLWMYDPSADSWTQKANFPGQARYGTIGFSIGDKGYAGLGGKKTGQGQYHYYKDFYEYDPVSDSWTQKADYPQPRGYASTFVLDGKGYVGLGHKASLLYKSFYSYDPASDSWHQATIFTGDGRAVAFSFSVNNKGYVGTGKNLNTGTFDKDVWEFGHSESGEKVKKAEPVTAGCWLQFTQFNNQLIPNPDHSADFNNLEFQLFDMNGRMVLSGQITDESTIPIDVNLPKGIYLIAVIKDQETCSQKISIR